MSDASGERRRRVQAWRIGVQVVGLGVVWRFDRFFEVSDTARQFGAIPTGSISNRLQLVTDGFQFLAQLFVLTTELFDVFG